MAFPWLVVLQTVPWTEVLKNAPKIADGAKKLWNTVSKKAPAQNRAAENAEHTPATAAESLAQLQSRLAAMEVVVTELHSQMLASSELIKTLAEQNAQLVRRIEEGRSRLVWLAGMTAVIGIAAVLGLVLVLGG
jgi:two-component sensor histidine kinase